MKAMIEIKRLEEIREHVAGLKAVVFDLDDTLYNEADYVRSGFTHVGETLLFEDASTCLYELFKEGKPAIDAYLVEKNCYSDDLRDKCLDLYRNHKPNIALKDEVENLLMDLRKQGLLLGIITDGRPEAQRAKIVSLGLEVFIDRIIVTDELGGPSYRKPNPEGFRLMKDYLKVDYSEMAYVGDNMSKDFIAPDKLGMRSILYKNENGLYKEG